MGKVTRKTSTGTPSTLPKNIDWDTAAPYYDAYVRTDLDVAFFLRAARRTGGPILELMCGTGRVTLPLVEAGFDVTGVDSSAALLAVCRAKLARRNLKARTIEADARTFALGETFPLVLIAFHAFAEILGRDERLRAMKAIRAHVAQRGRFVLTLHNPPVRIANAHAEWRDMGSFPLEAGTTLNVHSRWDVLAGGTRIHGVQLYRELDQAGTCVKEVSLPIQFDLVTPAEVRELAALVGLRIVDVFGNYEGEAFDEAHSPFAIFEMTPV